MECSKQFRNILFGYEIHVYSDHKNLIYKVTLSASQRVMHWRLLLEEFGPHIHQIAGVDNIVADTLSRVKSSNVGEDKSESSQKQMLQELYAAIKMQSILAEFPLRKGSYSMSNKRNSRKRNPH